MTKYLTPAAVVFAGLTFASTASAAILTVDCGGTAPYLTINAAILASAPGDTIAVHDCTYYENVRLDGVVDVHLIAAEAPTNTGSYDTGVASLNNPSVIIDGSGVGDCVSIRQASHVTVAGFRMQNCSTGIWNEGSSSITIHGNRVQNMTFAGYLEAFGFNNTVSGNIFGLAEYGIYVEGTDDLTIADNWVAFHTFNGILLFGNRVNVVNNTVQGCGYEGINVIGVDFNRIERNRVVGNATTGGLGNILINTGNPTTDAVGNDAGGTLVDLSSSDLGENI